jgi:hypothetical protein
MKIKTHRIINSPVVLYGCETWSRTLREESGLRLFEYRVLRGVFGQGKGGMRQLHNEELSGLYRYLSDLYHYLSDLYRYLSDLYLYQILLGL